MTLAAHPTTYFAERFDRLPSRTQNRLMRDVRAHGSVLARSDAALIGMLYGVPAGTAHYAKTVQGPIAPADRFA